MASRALIVSSLVETRLPLVQLMTRSALFREVHSVHSFDEARDLLREGERFNAVFMTQAFGTEEIAAFIERAKRAPSCEECAFVLVVKAEERTTEVISHHMLVGIHSFVSEPLSVEGIEEATRVGNAVRLQTSGVRMKAATGLMLVDVLAEAEKGTTPDPNANLWDKVQDSCRRFKELTGQSVTSSVVKDMEALAPSKRLPRYGGVSKRVKAAFERKLREHLAAFKKNSGRSSE